MVSWLLLLLSILISTLCIYPSPKHHSLTDSLKISTDSESCPSFSLHFADPSVLELMPVSEANKFQQNPGRYYLQKIMTRLSLSHKCSTTSHIPRQSHSIHLVRNNTLPKQAYMINSTLTHVQLQFSSYSGYVYAMETLSQMVSKDTIQLGIVEDEPIVSYRGIMIDSVRHFVGVAYIKKLILSMPLVKLNILHWHLSDDEAFVLEMIKHPELAESSRFGSDKSYSYDQVKQIIALAKANAISIVPEFDTPGHVRAWGLAKTWADKNITIHCNGGERYNHQLDVSKDDSYNLVKEVLAEADVLFKDSPYIHLGGDEVSGNCWSLRPSIKTFMLLKNIKNYGQLQMYWRYNLKQALSSSRKVIYWRNNNENLTTGADDVVQYWGLQAQTAAVTGASDSKLILSPMDYVYLNFGTTWIWMNRTNGDFSSWRKIYTNFTLRPSGVNPEKILGAEACLWNEIQDEDTLQNQIWMRAAAFAFKIWRNQVGPIATLVSDLGSLSAKLKTMGVQPSPVSSQWCQINPEKCFPTSAEE